MHIHNSFWQTLPDQKALPLHLMEMDDLHADSDVPGTPHILENPDSSEPPTTPSPLICNSSERIALLYPFKIPTAPSKPAPNKPVAQLIYQRVTAVVTDQLLLFKN